MPHRFSGTEKDQSSSDESWETLPGKEENEPELHSDSSGPEEENPELSLQEGYASNAVCDSPVLRGVLHIAFRGRYAVSHVHKPYVGPAGPDEFCYALGYFPKSN